MEMHYRERYTQALPDRKAFTSIISFRSFHPDLNTGNKFGPKRAWSACAVALKDSGGVISENLFIMQHAWYSVSFCCTEAQPEAYLIFTAWSAVCFSV